MKVQLVPFNFRVDDYRVAVYTVDETDKLDEQLIEFKGVNPVKQANAWIADAGHEPINRLISWDRTNQGYEVSSAGDDRFSAFNAMMPDSRSIEMWYQCDIKGYDVGGRNWRLGKGKPPLIPFNELQLYALYLGLWRLWVLRNHQLMEELLLKAQEHNNILTDRFASSNVNQARALAQILNEWFIG